MAAHDFHEMFLDKARWHAPVDERTISSGAACRRTKNLGDT
jgi:hypothetical protein